MRRLIVISGAGLSAESGVRTFRTDTASGKSLWDEYDLEEVCDISAFQAGYRRRTCPDQPIVGGIDEDGMDLYQKTNEFYNKRRVELGTVKPNSAHLKIGEWYNKYPGQVINVTTNVDDLLERAGIPKEDILHVHGFLTEINYRMHPGDYPSTVDVGYHEIDIEDYNYVKPNVVFFGENAPLYNDIDDLFDTMTSQDLFIIVGCSNLVVDFRSLLMTPVMYNKAKICEVNLYDPVVCQSAKYPSTVYSRSDMQLLDKYEVPHWDKGAVEAFRNQDFIKMVEDHLEGKTTLQKLGK